MDDRYYTIVAPFVLLSVYFVHLIFFFFYISFSSGLLAIEQLAKIRNASGVTKVPGHRQRTDFREVFCRLYTSTGGSYSSQRK